jgi:hypothetical protein
MAEVVKQFTAISVNGLMVAARVQREKPGAPLVLVAEADDGSGQKLEFRSTLGADDEAGPRAAMNDTELQAKLQQDLTTARQRVAALLSERVRSEALLENLS